MDVDHRDGNGLNNCRSNLRICRNVQNQWNKRKRANTASEFKGVTWHKATKKWRARITVDKKQIVPWAF